MKQELMQIARAWDKAIEENNLEKMATCVTDAWVLGGADGITEGKSFLKVVRSGVLVHTCMDFNPARWKMEVCAHKAYTGKKESA